MEKCLHKFILGEREEKVKREGATYGPSWDTIKVSFLYCEKCGEIRDLNNK